MPETYNVARHPRPEVEGLSGHAGRNEAVIAYRTSVAGRNGRTFAARFGVIQRFPPTTRRVARRPFRPHTDSPAASPSLGVSKEDLAARTSARPAFADGAQRRGPQDNFVRGPCILFVCGWLSPGFRVCPSSGDTSDQGTRGHRPPLPQTRKSWGSGCPAGLESVICGC